jgi:lipid-binding SYLF domain-containing protein
MKKIFTCVMSVLLMGLPPLFTATSALADDKEKDEDRLKNCGTVLKEILDIPDDVLKDLLDKADCVVVFPSVLKAAFVVGGSYQFNSRVGASGSNWARKPRTLFSWS